MFETIFEPIFNKYNNEQYNKQIIEQFERIIDYAVNTRKYMTCGDHKKFISFFLQRYPLQKGQLNYDVITLCQSMNQLCYQRMNK